MVRRGVIAKAVQALVVLLLVVAVMRRMSELGGGMPLGVGEGLYWSAVWRCSCCQKREDR